MPRFKMRKIFISFVFLAIPSQSFSQTGFLVGENAGDFYKTCNYDVLGDIMSINISAAKICPSSHNFNVQAVVPNPRHSTPASPNKNQTSPKLNPQDQIVVECSDDESTFKVTFFTNDGPTTVYKDDSLWHRFNTPRVDSQSVQSVALTSVGYKNDLTGKTFKSIDLDRITGKVQIASWSDYKKTNFFSGGRKSKRDFHLKFRGDCSKMIAESPEQKF